MTKEAEKVAIPPEEAETIPDLSQVANSGKDFSDFSRSDTDPHFSVKEMDELQAQDEATCDTSEQLKPQTAPVDRTRELPALVNEELWFLCDTTPEPIAVDSELSFKDEVYTVLSCISSQAFERKYRVRASTGEIFLLKQAPLNAPFIRYEIEAQLLEELNELGHEGFLKPIGYWQNDQNHLLLTAYPGGVPYTQLLDQKELDLATHASIVQDIVSCLEPIHQLGYILTSLRPSSIFVQRHPVEKVTLVDFLNLTQTVEIPPYALASPFTAPEVTELVPADEGVDIYSIGALLYSAVTGEEAPTTYQRLFLPENQQAQAPVVFQVLTRCLSAPSERFFDLVELSKALRQLARELTPRLQVSVAMRSSTGINPLRIVNQDSGAYLEQKSHHRSEQKHLGFYCVADGMGGHEDGDRASELAVQGALRCFQELLLEHSHEDIALHLHDYCKEIAAAASKNLVDTVAQEGGGRRMGTTFTAVLLAGNKLALSHLGDSRAILFRDQELLFLSEDHSLVGMMVKAGQMTAEQAENADEKNILMRSLGAENLISSHGFDGLDVTQGEPLFEVKEGDRLILVSDGVWGMIPRIDMTKVFERCPLGDTNKLADELCAEAIERVGSDNVIVIALDFSAEEEFAKLFRGIDL